MFWIEKRPSTCHPLLVEHPELMGAFSGSLHFPNEYVFESLLLYWFGWLLLYESIPHIYREPQHSTGQSDLRYTGLDDSTIISAGHGLPDDIETSAASSAEKLCQAVEFCLKPTCGAAAFQVILPALWATLQFYSSRPPLRKRWCQMIFKACEERGLILGGIVNNVKFRNFSDIAEAVRV